MALSQKEVMVPFNVSRATILFMVLMACSMVECATLLSTGTVNYQVIKYYVHDDLLQRANNSAFVIAAPGGDLSTIQQGALVAINDLITEGPEADSRKLGNAQGVYLSSELEPNSFHIHQQFTAVFKDKYNGTICYQGDDEVLLPVREIAVVGGTGEFRNAFGYCLITTVKQTDTWSFLLEFETHLYIPELNIIQTS